MANKVDVLSGDGFYKGTNFEIHFQSLEDDGSPESISAFALQYTLWLRPESATPLLTKTVGSGIVITDGANGMGKVVFVPADTASLKPGVYFHKLKRTDTGSISSILPGKGHRAASLVLLPSA
jgi:hypothetical protein